MKSLLLRGVFLMYTSFVFHSFCSLVSHFALLLVLELGLLLSMIVVIGSGSAASAVATSSAIMTELFDSAGLRRYTLTFAPPR